REWKSGALERVLNSLRGRVHVWLLVDVEAVIHQARQAGAAIITIEHVVIEGVSLSRDDLWSSRAVDVNHGGYAFTPLWSHVARNGHKTSRVGIAGTDTKHARGLLLQHNWRERHEIRALEAPVVAVAVLAPCRC